MTSFSEYFQRKKSNQAIFNESGKTEKMRKNGKLGQLRAI